MGRTRFVIFVMLLVGLIGTMGCIGSARELAKAELKVVVNVPVMQKLTILEPVEVAFAYPQKGQDVVLTDVGKVRVQSNASWALTVGAAADVDLDIEVRPAGDTFARWQRADGRGGIYTGPQGSQDISWDVKVANRRLAATKAGMEGRVQLLFTLGQL